MIRVGVLRGGTSNQYGESLETGAYVLKHLPRETYEVLDIFLDKDGVWHLSGKPLSHEKLKMRVDVVWNALHGFYGEDGKVQQLLESLGIPYTGSGALSSAIAMNKKLAKGYLAQSGIKTPRGVYIESWGGEDREAGVAEVVKAVSTKFSPPWIVEPISRGYGSGSVRAKTREELGAVLSQMCELDIPVLVEEAVLGKEVSLIAMKNLRGKSVYTFLPAQKGKTKNRFQKDESEKLQKLARDVHASLGLDAYSRVAAVINSKGHVFVVGVDTLPSFHSDSDLHAALDAVGVTFAEFADRMISEALKRK